MGDITLDTSSASPIDTAAQPVANDLPILIGQFPANARDTARVSLEKYKGYDLVCIGKWYVGQDGELLPGRGGFKVQVRHLPQLKQLVDLALAKAIEVGLVPSSDGGTPS
jgi:Transcriptional Coactivator p15 (PC4)